MTDNQLIKHNNLQLDKVSNTIAVTEKLLALTELQLIPYRRKAKWGFCTPDKKIVIDCLYDRVHFFRNKTAIVEIDNKKRLINEQGVSISNEYDDICDSENCYPDYAVKDGNKWGLIDKKGNIVVDVKYQYVQNFREDYIVVTENNKVKFLNKNFENVFDKEFLWADGFSEGLAASGFVNGDIRRIGYIDNQGRQVIPNQFHFAEKFKNGLAYVYVPDKGYNYINRAGELQFKRNDSSLYSEFNDGLAKVWGEDYTLTKGLCGFINTDFQLQIPFEYCFVHSFSEGLAWVKKNENSYYIDTNNNIQIDLGSSYCSCNSFSNGLAKIQISEWPENEYNFINKKGEFVFKTALKWADDFQNGYVMVVLFNGEYGYIDKNGIQYWE